MRSYAIRGAVVLAFSLAMLSGCVSSRSEESPRCTTVVPSEMVAKFQEHLDTLNELGSVGVVGEIQDGCARALARSGVRDINGTEPVPWDAEFRTGSFTKTPVAIVILQLVGEGHLSLDDTVDDW